MNELLTKAIVIVIGSFLLGLGINIFLIPDHVLDGGVIGIGLIANYLWGLKTGLTIILISIPIFTIAWFRYRAYFYNSLHGLLLSSFFIDLFSSLRSYHLSIPPAVSAFIGGILVGLGIGLMLRYQTSTGGTDLLAQMIADTAKMNVGVVIFLIDFTVIIVGGLLFSTQTLILSALTIASVAIATTLCTSRMVLSS